MTAELLDVDGVSIEVSQIPGAGDGNLVLLHEGLGCVELWRDFPEKLCRSSGYSVTTYSRTGYGNSTPIELPRPINYMRREAQLFLPQLLTRLAIERPVLLGHSDGATIALEFAAAFPQALSALILMAPHVFVEDEAIAAIDEANLAYDKGELRKKLERYHGDNVDNAFRGWCDTWLDPAFRSWDMRSALKNIQAPTLQFQGSADEYGTLAQTQSIESENGGQVTTVIFDDCGHSPHQDKPAETLNEIVNFIKTLKAN